MSDRKQFITVMVVAALFVGWIGWRGFEVTHLNAQLKGDRTVASYPYQHRVLRVEGDTAETFEMCASCWNEFPVT